MRGRTSSTCSQKGGSLRPLLRRGAVSPNDVPEKKVCVLGMGCGNLASASELTLKQVGPRGSVSHGRVLPIAPFGHKPGVHGKSQGYTSLDHFAYFRFFNFNHETFPLEKPIFRHTKPGPPLWW